MTTDLLERSKPKALRRKKLLPLHKRHRKRFPPKKRLQYDLYVKLPRSITKNPRIRDPRRCGELDLTNFELAVLAGCICLANDVYVGERHDRVYAWNGSRIKRERLTGQYHRERFRRHREQGLPTNFATSLTRDAKSNYRAKSRRVKPDDVITVQSSFYAIVRRGGLTSTSSANPVKVQQALNRLRERVGNMDSPILSLTKLEGGRVQFDFRGHWLDPPYVRVPLPFPLRCRSPNTVNLYLWAMSIGGLQLPKLWQRKGFKTLCETIGIRTSQGSPRSSDELQQAVQLLNAHLNKLSRAELAQLKPPIILPKRYEIEAVKGDHVRLASYFDEETE